MTFVLGTGPPTVIELVEYSTSLSIPLTSLQARSLADYRVSSIGSVGKNPLVTVSPGRDQGTYDLRAGNIVGSVQINDLAIVIRPKIGSLSTAQMLVRSLDISRIDENDAPFTAEDLYVELLAQRFMAEVEGLLKAGLIEDYIDVVEHGSRPHGSIKFALMARRPDRSKLVYQYDDFTGDFSEHQLLYCALMTVSEMQCLSHTATDQARYLASNFAGVTYSRHPKLYGGEPLPDRFVLYREALVLASWILENITIEVGSGSVAERGLLFDMNLLAEKYALSVLREVVPPTLAIDVQGAGYPRFLDEGHRLRVFPDFAFWRQNDCVIVGDIKYKSLVANAGPKRGDLYQMVSYLGSLNAKIGVLLYVGAATVGRRNIVVSFGNYLVAVYGVDLRSSEEDFRAQLSEIVGQLAFEVHK